ncbi:MAG TPA: hypothetical protein VNA20_03025 [Frankiaceae bacterium]|nr:hypothetical protein [Frankiaceae bacterium]
MLRRLALRKETVAELTTDELTTVVAGYSEIKFACISGIVACVTHRCVTDENCLTVVGGC